MSADNQQERLDSYIAGYESSDSESKILNDSTLDFVYLVRGRRKR